MKGERGQRLRKTRVPMVSLCRMLGAMTRKIVRVIVGYVVGAVLGAAATQILSSVPWPWIILGSVIVGTTWLLIDGFFVGRYFRHVPGTSLPIPTATPEPDPAPTSGRPPAFDFGSAGLSNVEIRNVGLKNYDGGFIRAGDVNDTVFDGVVIDEDRSKE